MEMIIANNFTYQAQFILFRLLLILSLLLLNACDTKTDSKLATISTPKGLIAKPGARTVNLNWSGVPGANAYTVYWSNRPDVSKFNGATIPTSEPFYHHQALANGITYYYVVTAQTSTGESSASKTVSTTPQATVPEQPEPLQGKAGDGRVTLNWRSALGATHYILYWHTQPNVTTEHNRIDRVSAPFVHQGLSNEQTYYYKLIAVNTHGQSESSDELSMVPQKPLPTAALITAVNTVSGQASIEWRNSSNASHFDLFWSDKSGVTDAAAYVNNVNSPYVHAPLNDGQDYFYRIRAANSRGVSAFSNEVHVVVPGTVAIPVKPAVSAPQNLTRQLQDSQLTLDWTPVDDAIAYNLYWNQNVMGVTKADHKIANIQPPYTHVNLHNGTSYHYRVSAINNDGESDLSIVEVTGTPQPITPGVPAGVEALAGDQWIALRWTEVEGASAYNVYVDGNLAVVNSGVNSPHVINGLENGAHYTVKVSAINGSVESEAAPTEGISITPHEPVANAPTQVSAEPGNGQVVLQWSSALPQDVNDPNEAITQYQVYYSSHFGVSPQNGTLVNNAQAVRQADNTWLITHSQLINGHSLTNGQKYYYVVTAINSGGQSRASQTVWARPQAPIPNVPKNAWASAGNNEVIIYFGEASNITSPSYNLYWQKTSGDTDRSAIEVISGINSGYIFNDGNSANGNTYYFQVSVFNDNGVESGKSNEFSARPQQPPPRIAPRNIIPTASSQSAQLNWDPLPEANGGYALYWSTQPDINPETSLRISLPAGTTDFTHSNLNNGEVYNYRIAGVNPGGEGVLSDVVIATPQIPPPATPQNLTADAGDAKVILNWTEVPTATSYLLYWHVDNIVPIENWARVNGVQPGYTHTGMANNQTYYFRLVAVNPGGHSAAGSPDVSATPQAPIPAAPLGVSAAAGDGQVYLNWKTEPGLSYSIYWSADANVSPQDSGKVISGTSVIPAYIHHGLTNQTRYYYQVTATNATGEGLPSVVVAATPAAPITGAPVAFSATGADQRITLQWLPSPGATLPANYTLYWSKVAGEGINGTAISNVTSPYVHTNLNNGQTYYYVVTATNQDGVESAASNQAMAQAVGSLPTTVTNVSVISGDTQLILEWSPVANATQYLIKRSNTADMSQAQVVSVNAPSTKYTDTGLTNDVTYYYRLTALNDTGASDPTIIYSGTPVTTTALQIVQGPSVSVTMDEDGSPQNFSLTLTTNATIDSTLNWQITQAPVSGNASVTATGLQGIVAYVPTPNFNGTDTFNVQVVDNNGDSAGIEVTAVINPVNDAPEFSQVPFVLTNIENEVIVPFAIKALDADIGDTIIYSANGLPPGITLNNTTGEVGGQITIGAAASSPHSVTFTADDQSAQPNATVSTSPIMWIVGVSAPTAPSGLTASVNGSAINLAWNLEAGHTYTIYRSITPNINIAITKPLVTDHVTGTYADQTAFPGQELYYVVTASLGGVNSAPSAEVSANIPMQQENLLSIGSTAGSLDYLVNIDALTGVGTQLSGNGLNGFASISALAYDNASNVLYGLNRELDNYRLISLDPDTGDGNSIGFLGVNTSGGISLAFDSTNTILYAVKGDGDLYTVNTNTGTSTFVTNLGVNVIGGLAVDAVGNLYTLSEVNPNEIRLIFIDSNTYQGTPVGSTVAKKGNLSFDPLLETLLLTTKDGEVSQLDITTAQLSSIGNFSAILEYTTFNNTSRVLYTIGFGSPLTVIYLPKPQYNGLEVRNVASKLRGLLSFVFNPSTGLLVGIDNYIGEMITIDPSTSKATSVGNFSQASGELDLTSVGLAIDPKDSTTIYVAAGGKLYSVNSVDWTVALLHGTGIPKVSDLAYDPTTNAETLYGLFSNKLIAIDIITGTVSSEVGISVPGMSGITSVPNSTNGVYSIYGTANGRLYKIDKSSGLATEQGTGLTSGAILTYGNGVIYFGRIGSIRTIDPITSIIQIKSPHSTNTIRSIAFESEADASGILYGVGNESPVSNALFTLDKATGIGTRVGPINYTGNVALAVDPNTKKLYGANYVNSSRTFLTEIDKFTGASVEAPNPMGYTISGMAFTDSGQLFAVDGTNRQLLTVETVTGIATPVFSLLIPTASKLTFDTVSQKFITIAGDNLLSIDPTSGTIGTLGQHNSGLSNIAYDSGNSILYFRSIAAGNSNLLLLTSRTGTWFGPQIQDMAMDPDTKILYGIETFYDRLVSIDSISGAMKTIGDVGVGFQNLVSISYDKSTKNFISFDNTLGHFVAIDKTTGEGSPVGPRMQSITLDSMAQNHQNGTLFGVSATSLYELDPATGLANNIGQFLAAGSASPLNVPSIVVDATGNIFGALGDELVNVNSSTAEVKVIGKMGFGETKGLAIDTSDSFSKTIYGGAGSGLWDIALTKTNADTGKSQTIGRIPMTFNIGTNYMATDSADKQVYMILNSALYTVNSINGTFAYVGETGLNSHSGLTFDDVNNRLLTYQGSELTEINPLTGAGTVLNLPNLTDMIELAFNNQNNTLYGLSNSHNRRLVAIDQETGLSQVVGDPGSTSLFGFLSFDTSNNIFFSQDNNIKHLLLIDPFSGVVYKTLPFTGLMSVNGLTHRP